MITKIFIDGVLSLTTAGLTMLMALNPMITLIPNTQPLEMRGALSASPKTVEVVSVPVTITFIWSDACIQNRKHALLPQTSRLWGSNLARTLCVGVCVLWVFLLKSKDLTVG